MSGYEDFFSEHYDEVVRTLALATGDRGRAEDAAQEAFAKAFRKWPTVRSMDRPVGWVVVVGTRDLRRWITRHDRRFGVATDSTASDPGVSAAWATGLAGSPDPADTVVNTVSVRDALDALPPRQRATVVLRHLAGLSTEETAKALGCSPGTVKSALSAALASLRVELDDTGDSASASAPAPVPASAPDPARTELTGGGERHA